MRKEWKWHFYWHNIGSSANIQDLTKEPPQSLVIIVMGASMMGNILGSLIQPKPLSFVYLFHSLKLSQLKLTINLLLWT